MKINGPIRQSLTGKTVNLLSHVLDYRAKNHAVISGNVSNMDTPGFEPKEVAFDEELKRAVDRSELPLKRTDGRHLSNTAVGALKLEPSFSVQTYPYARGKSEDLDIDREMAKMAENNLLYEATVRMLSKKFEALRMAIEERRR
jgi:flagellar basal-body rod protein FlgB